MKSQRKQGGNKNDWFLWLFNSNLVDWMDYSKMDKWLKGGNENVKQI